LSSCLLSKKLDDKTIILPVPLYGCEILSLILREENRLKVLRRIFGPQREEVVGNWRRQHYEELHNLYVSSNIIRVIKSRRKRWVGHGSDDKCILYLG
jgi:hypothetical protein